MSFQLHMAAEARLPTRFGEFRILGFEGRAVGGRSDEAVVLRMGEFAPADAPLVRIHSQCLTGDVFHSLRCDCRAQLEQALEMIADEGKGILIYEMQEGRGIGIMNKLRAYALQDGGADTVEANLQLGLDVDLRNYELPAAILRSMGLTRVRLMSNNPEKIGALESVGITVERLSAETDAPHSAQDYLRVKKEKLGHLIDGV
jgi:GTP cyclohydrolase II